MTVKIDDSALLTRKLGRQINDYIVGELKKHGICGIVTSHGGILYHLFNKESLKMGEIAELIDKDRSTVTTLISKLSSMGYVKLEKDKSDKRANLVSLTEKGKAIEPIMDEISYGLNEIMYRGISSNERSEYYNTLRKMISNFNS